MKYCVSISGGSDSDCLIDLMERESDWEIDHLWFDTGMEYEATVRHIKYLEERYGVSVRRLKSEGIEEVCKRVGVPFLSKHISMMIGRLQRKGFKWEDGSYEVLRERYKGCESALKWRCDIWSGRFGISYRKGLKEFLMKYPPTFKISEKCCEYRRMYKEFKRNKSQ